MDLFGKKALAEVQRDLDDAQCEVEKARKDVNELRAREQEALGRAARAAEECANLRSSVTDAERERDREKEARAKAEQMAAWLEEREARARLSIKAAEQARDEAVEKAARVQAECDTLRTEVAGLRKDLASRSAERPAPQADATTGLKSDNEMLRRRLAENEERLRVALRKAEHNRRAYLITQMQLDLAEDRISMLTLGKPRPTFSTGQRPIEVPAEKVVAEDVEEFAEEPAREPEGPDDDAGS